jgi:hypothetical protein
MSALDEDDGQRLRARIDAFFAQQLTEESLVIPCAKAPVLAEFRDSVQVLQRPRTSVPTTSNEQPSWATTASFVTGLVKEAMPRPLLNPGGGSPRAASLAA